MKVGISLPVQFSEPVQELIEKALATLNLRKRDPICSIVSASMEHLTAMKDALQASAGLCLPPKNTRNNKRCFDV